MFPRFPVEPRWKYSNKKRDFGTKKTAKHRIIRPAMVSLIFLKKFDLFLVQCKVYSVLSDYDAEKLCNFVISSFSPVELGIYVC